MPLIFAARSIEVASGLLAGTGGNLGLVPLSLGMAVALLMPLVSGVLLLLDERRKGRRILHVIAWVLAAGVGLWMMTQTHIYAASWALWGSPMYVGVALAALALEAGIWLRSKRTGMNILPYG